MEYVGNPGPEGFDEVVVRGDRATRPASSRACWLRGGRVVAGMHVNDWDAIDQVRALVGRRSTPTAWPTSRSTWTDVAG